MKRFTETNKWANPWFRQLSPKHKLLWTWVVDSCDSAGVLDPDFGLASFVIGETVCEEDMRAFNGRVEKLENGKYHLPKFTDFQYGELNPDCRPHRHVIGLLAQHGLSERVLVGYPKGTVSLKEQDKEQDKEKEQDRKAVLDAWNASGFHKCLKLTDSRRALLNKRLSDPFWRANWRAALERIRASKFCRGENEKGWKADFDFFCRQDTLAKALEGKYDDKRPFKADRTSGPDIHELRQSENLQIVRERLREGRECPPEFMHLLDEAKRLEGVK